ncbi:MAG: hypothetical protein Q9163_000970 [Psora crenata]
MTTSPNNHAQAMSYSNPASIQPKVINAQSQYLTTKAADNCFKDSNSVDNSNFIPTALLPKGWFTDREGLILAFSHFDHNDYGIPRPIPIAHERTNIEVLMECGSRYLLYNAISGVCIRIDYPTNPSEILKAMHMPDSDYQDKELDPLPDSCDYNTDSGWSFEPKTLGPLLHRVPTQEYGLTHVRPIVGHEEKGLLLFRQDYVERLWDEEWKYFIWDQKSIHRVDEPTNLDDTIESLIAKGFPNNETLRTTELRKSMSVRAH